MQERSFLVHTHASLVKEVFFLVLNNVRLFRLAAVLIEFALKLPAHGVLIRNRVISFHFPLLSFKSSFVSRRNEILTNTLPSSAVGKRTHPNCGQEVLRGKWPRD